MGFNGVHQRSVLKWESWYSWKRCHWNSGDISDLTLGREIFTIHVTNPVMLCHHENQKHGHRNSALCTSGIFLTASGSSTPSLRGIDHVGSESNAKGEAATTRKGHGDISQLALIKIHVFKRTQKNWERISSLLSIKIFNNNISISKRV